MGDAVEGFVALHLDRALVHLQGILEGELLLTEVQLLGASVRLPHVPANQKGRGRSWSSRF